MTIENFNYKEFAKIITERTMDLVPNELKKEQKDYIFKTLSNFTLLAGEAINSDNSLNFNLEQAKLFVQIIAEWTLKKIINLINNNSQNENAEEIMQTFAFAIFEIAKNEIKENLTQEKTIKNIENQAYKILDKNINELSEIASNIIARTEYNDYVIEDNQNYEEIGIIDEEDSATIVEDYVSPEDVENRQKFEELTEKINKNPKDENLLFARAQFLFEKMHYPIKAIDDMNLLINLNPNNAEYYEYKGFIDGSIEDFSNAIDDFTKAIELNPTKSINYYYRGYANNQSIFNYGNAIDDFNKCLELGDNTAKIYIQRAYSYLLIEKNDLAINDYTKAIELEPNNIQAYISRAELKRDYVNDFEGAIEDYNTVLTLDPENVIALEGLEQTKDTIEYYKNEQETINNLNKQIEENPTASAYCELAYYCSDNYEKAIDLYTKAIELDPKFVEAYQGRANCYYSLEDKQKQLADYEEILKLKPNEIHSYWQIVNYILPDNDYNEAIKLYSKAIENNITEAYFERARLYIKSKQFDKAEEDYMHCKNNKTWCAQILATYGETYKQIEDYEKSLEYYYQAIKLDIEDELDQVLRINFKDKTMINFMQNFYSQIASLEAICLYQEIADVYAKMKEYNQALEILNFIIDGTDHKGSVYYTQRGKIKMLLNDNKGAIEDFETAISYFPDEEEAMSLRELAISRL